MREQEVRELYEVYMQVHSQVEEVEQLDENVQGAVSGALKAGADFMKTNPVGKAVSSVIAPVGKGKGTVTAPQQKQKISQNEEVEPDFFDAILEHLVSGGYADTNESALAIMANMSEDWRYSIVEETKRTQYLQKKFNRENERKSGSALQYIPGKQNTGQSLQKARQSERHMRGER